MNQVSSKDKLPPLIKQLKDHLNFVEIIPVSAKTGQKVGELESLICQYLPQNPFFYSEKDIVQISENFYVAEIVRRERLLDAWEMNYLMKLLYRLAK